MRLITFEMHPVYLILEILQFGSPNNVSLVFIHFISFISRCSCNISENSATGGIESTRFESHKKTLRKEFFCPK